MIRATDANGKNYEFVGGGTVTSGSPDILAYTAGAAQCSTEILKDTVDYMNPLTLNWEVTWGGSPVWHPVGQSRNTAYVTWRDPTPATLYETILLVGCRGANGTTSSDEDDIIAGVWSEFTSVSDGVERADGVHMGYWLTGDPAQDIGPYDTPTKLGMLQRSNGDGSCIAWSQLLHGSLEAQGLGTYSAIYRIDPNMSLNPDAGGFLVKDWTFPRHIRTGSDATRESPVLGDDIPVPPSGTNSVCILPGPTWTLDSVTAGTDVYADELFPGASWPHRVGYDTFPGTYPGTRIPAQNNAGSPYWFVNHWVCKIKGQVYDPSYGAGPYPTESAHENDAIDGLRDDTAPPDPPYAKKDNDSVQELVYTRDSNKE